MKHVPVSMFATFNYVEPEYTRCPDLWSPAYGVEHADVPTSFRTFSKVAFAGLIG